MRIMAVTRKGTVDGEQMGIKKRPLAYYCFTTTLYKRFSNLTKPNNYFKIPIDL